MSAVDESVPGQYDSDRTPGSTHVPHPLSRVDGVSIHQSEPATGILRDVVVLKESVTPHDLLVVTDDTPERRLPLPRAALVVLMDVLGLCAAALVVPSVAPWSAVAGAMTVALLALGGLYRPRLRLSILDDLPFLVGRSLAAVAVAGLAFLASGATGEAQSFARAMAAVLVAVPAARLVTYSVVHALRRRRIVTHRTLLLGSGPIAAELAVLLKTHREHGLTPIGYVDDTSSDEFGSQLGPRLGALPNLDEIIATYDVRVLLIAFAEASDTAIIDLLRSGSAARCDLFVVPRLFEVTGMLGVSDHIGAIPVIRLRRPRARGLSLAMKRSFDLVATSAALLLLSPVLLACAVAVRTTGPDIIFRQQRIGKDGKTFDLLKFRSMRPAEAAITGTAWRAVGDPRITRVGKFLRKTSLDELPQLWNILRGEMTVVGPRPERPFFVDQFTREVRDYGFRHRVPVGLTGLAQVSGLRGGDASIERRARYDNYYIDNWSLWTDVKVVLRTVREVTSAKGG